MNTIIADKLRTEQTVSTRIDLFFKQIGLSKLLKKSNFYKESGIPCTEILKTLFTLVFADKNLYRMLDTNPEQIEAIHSLLQVHPHLFASGRHSK